MIKEFIIWADYLVHSHKKSLIIVTISMDAEKKLTAEERRRLDRQRFIGLETQRK